MMEYIVPELALLKKNANAFGKTKRTTCSLYLCLVWRCLLSPAEQRRQEWMEKVKRLELKSCIKHRRGSFSVDKAEVRERILYQCGGGIGFTGLVGELACGTGRKNLFGCLLYSLL